MDAIYLDMLLKNRRDESKLERLKSDAWGFDFGDE